MRISRNGVGPVCCHLHSNSFLFSVIDSFWLWTGFNLFVLAMLALDLGVFHRQAHVVSLRESITWTVVWVTLAALFGGGV